ncbi:hypothetical protein OUZ56_019520 [Daphnia magna]|uniref:Lactosylceramide n=1 Tax=Daphnia magna TaxID=35525 RepID=A0ABQ9ZCE7_9CRUS|nr:hypothetical protein OUZ56_019520 [Daphnia magna]
MGIHSREPKCRRGLAMIVMIIFGSLLSVFVSPINDKRERKTLAGPSETVQGVMAVHSELLPEKKLSICIGNLLDQREFYYEKEKNGFLDSSRLISKTGPCWLRRYTVEHAVTCFDRLDSNRDKLETNPVLNRRKQLRFVFMGDSRIRQQFLNFIRLIPDYDKQSLPNPIPFHHHGDIEITSDILGVRVSFKWRPLINDNVTETIRQWAITDSPERPYWIFLSMTAWHMLQGYGADYQLYQKKISELGPLLGQLANVSQVIWLHQYPSVDFYGGIRASNTDIVSEKIYGYNKITRKILESLRTRIRIWDSSNPLVEEYTRDCTILKRDEKAKIGDPSVPMDYASAYFNCDDYIHTGYAALSQATQLLFNDICNSQME